MKYLWIILLCLTTLPATAQSMRVEDFVRYRKSTLRKTALRTDRHQALLDLYTNEQDFQFLSGDISIPAAAGEGFITLSLPPHTEFLTVKHPDYGQLIWKVPGPELKKKKRYRAYLYTESLKKEFQQTKQWALFSVQPEHAIVYVDSSMYPIHDGQLSLYLPLGKHACRIESPFYQTRYDTIELTDSARLEKQFFLDSFYAYLTVETDLPQALILLDGQPLGTHRIETGRLMPGKYRLSLRLGDRLYYDRFIEIANAERKVIDLRQTILKPLSPNDPPSEEEYAQTTAPGDVDRSASAGARSASDPALFSGTVPKNQRSNVHITAFDAQTEIWLNREKVATGEWRGALAPGFYAVSSRKEGLESRTVFFWVETGRAVELNLVSPLADYGLLNIACDEVDAEIFLNDIAVGYTPCVLRDLPTDRSYRIRLVKGEKTAECILHLKGNDIVNVNLQLRKK